ncbi:armadillo repeat protein [Arthroderma uncinatum]|uniref:armadillo repeat protein n=1 Tax=Arthroderma uncinatum TaxID=74035 RepID=UPI00144AF51C|nr:armadillo repeat protein [Arthroderma uncinatum]KAF3483521.1 armadillo repeat protein [Arthroderma uncinatum]
MTKVVSPRLLEDVRNADSPAARIAALRALKNDIIGHHQKKQAWTEIGILPLLSDVLSSRRGVGKKADYDSPRQHQTEEDEMCFQAITIIGSLALGGPAYTSPILAGETIPSLLSILSSPTCPTSLALAVLQTLNTIADQLALVYKNVDSQTQPMGALLFTRRHIPTFRDILQQSGLAPGIQPCIELVADLISKTCTGEHQKSILTESGVLDALGLRLSTFIVAGGFVLPGAENSCTNPGALGYIPYPAPADAKLTPILRAIAVIIEQSGARAEHLLTCPALVTVFPKSFYDPYLGEARKGPWKSPYSSGYGFAKRNFLNPIDSLLPSVPMQINGSSNFPPLGSQPQYDKRGQFFGPQVPCAESPPPEEPESVLISWLLYVARADRGYVRLMAARILSTLFRVQLLKKHRVRMLGFLLVPLLVRMLDSAHLTTEDSSTFENYMSSSTLRVKEEAPAVLASLVMDSKELQEYAFNSGAIKKLSQMLKESFGPTSEDGTPMWSATKRPAASLLQSTDSDMALGPPGFTRQALSKIKYREAILRALAALSLFRDDYRKTICDYGVVQHIIDSMKPWNPETTILGNKTSIVELEGNPTPVVLAACAAARSLTRSVSVLRTSLIDAGIAAPICALVKSNDIVIQIAATSVVCNLALDFSPMKEALLEANMIPILCENSHSPNANLRIESLWSLKHISYSVPNKTKKDILEDLGIEWIKEVLSHDPNDPSNYRRRQDESTSGMPSSLIEMGAANSFGEQVDILNPMTMNSGLESEAPVLDFESSKSPLDALSAENIRKRKLILNGDLDQTKKLRQDDTLAQEELFDLLRNIMCGPGAPDMIDYILQKLGQGDFLDILADKLRPRPFPTTTAISNPPTMSGFKDSRSQISHQQQQKTILHPTEIIRAVTYVLIHIAAGFSRHRHLLVFHQDLLKLTMALLNHSNWQIRANCVWIVINLTLDDDKTDRPSRVERAMRLKSLGVMERLSSLEIDSEADVRERTKTALDWMKALLGQ